MTEDEFNALFANDDIKDVTEVFAAIAAETPPTPVKPKKDGINYTHDEQDANGHTLSVYMINLGGKTIAWAVVDNDYVETDENMLAPLGEVPDYVTAHRIRIENATRTDGYLTKGLALRYPHGNKVHVGVTAIRAYIGPRIAHIVGRLYGI